MKSILHHIQCKNSKHARGIDINFILPGFTAFAGKPLRGMGNRNGVQEVFRYSIDIEPNMYEMAFDGEIRTIKNVN
jgi:hypothetical protein